MKKLIVPVAVMFALLLCAVLRRPSPGLFATPENRPVCDAPERILEAESTDQTVPEVLKATPATQAVTVVPSTMADSETDPDRRSEALERAVESISDAELPGRLSALTLQSGPEAAEMSLLLVRRWAGSDPSTAAAWASQLGENSLSQAALKQVAIAWANTDLAAAADWARALPEGNSKQVATLGLAYEAARTEPLAALDLAGALPPTCERDDLLVHAVSQWVGMDASAAAAWTMKVPDPDLRQRLVASVAIALAEQDAVAAVSLVANSVAPGDEQDRAAVSIVQRWAQQSPQTAASWVAQFPAIPSRDAAVQNLFSIWTTQDSEAAENWRRKL